jgi:two-component system cell cycle sensor histidine kinase/response regulator CckA
MTSSALNGCIDDIFLLVAMWPVAAVVFDVDGRVMSANEGFYQRARHETGQPVATIIEELSDDQRQALTEKTRVYLPEGEGRADWFLQPLSQTGLIFCYAPNSALQAPLTAVPPVVPSPGLDPNLDQWQDQKLQALGQLAGGVAHDFNNILTAIQGHCDLLLERVGPGDALFGDIIQIRHNGQRAAGLVRQLLAFSRQQTLTPQPVAVQPLLMELLHLLRRLVGERVVIDLEWADDLPIVLVDSVQLEQMIINLVVNARDAMQGSGRITLKLSSVINHQSRLLVPGDILPVGDYLVVGVDDDGPGIDSSLHPRLFEPFFTTKPVGQGTGLGLAMVHGAIRQMQGFVDLQSQPGGGTQFSLWLPVLTDPEQKPLTRPALDVPLSPLALASQGEEIVLLVEDEDPVRRITARTLRHKGYTVIDVASGYEAIAIIDDRQQRIDLFVSDVILPDMDAPHLVGRLRMARPDVPILLMSGYAAESVREQMGESGAIDFLPKPFSLKDFIQAVRNALDGRKVSLMAG